MRLETEWFDYETDDHDAEIARNLKTAAESVRDLSSNFIGERVRPCWRCNDKASCRPLAVGEDGQPKVVWVCFDCQEWFVEEQVQHARAQANPDGDLPVEPEDGDE